jgi:UDP-3-O-[3-hydroxymyristoyl] N-acetylglucosamine deacetylase / 3-hydroxyacyl-[acyl-carrier-protein] dehydratase
VSIACPQKSIAAEASVSGRGLFTSTPATLTFKPAPPGHGIVFVRTDLSRPVRIPALVQHVTKRSRRTAIKSGADTVETIEHCMSAVAGLGLDNLEIEITGPEVPGMDGSSLPFVEALTKAGIVEQPAERQSLTITAPLEVRDGGAALIASPPNAEELQIFYDLDYGNFEPIKQQFFAYELSGSYAAEIAPSRTFVTKAEADTLRARGLGTHLQPGDVLVIDTTGPIDTQFRFPNECVRHKVLDLLGDLYLLGCPIRGKIVAHKSGHSLNHVLVRRLTQMFRTQHRSRLALGEPVMDVRHILRVMPHRYPMLLVDRVIEMDGDRRAVGIKNVTMNEPFFEGHYPGMPMMPGVLIVEALAQLSGLLLSQKLEHTGKIPVLLSLDKVKLRRPVVPGDQLILESVNIRVKARTGHVRCRAYVGDQVAAEAEIKFMLVDNELGG